jgi:hypothetical protein
MTSLSSHENSRPSTTRSHGEHANLPSRKQSNKLSLDPSDERSGIFQSGLPPEHHPTREDKLKEQRDKVNKESLATIKSSISPDLRRKVQRRCDTGAWFSVLPSPMAGTELLAYEFCDSLAIGYDRTPTGLQPTCDRCSASFSARHAL